MTGEDEELERIKKQKLLELQRQMEEASRREEVEAEREALKRTILSQILEPKARERLATVKLAYPHIAEQIENELVYLAQIGKIGHQITDEELKGILRKVMPKKKDIRIIRR
ncbi:MAG: DNA-binding protein [Thermoplasmata archaeon]|nr:DNA-binding protein [Thermoplasmata archaeon]